MVLNSYGNMLYLVIHHGRLQSCKVCSVTGTGWVHCWTWDFSLIKFFNDWHRNSRSNIEAVLDFDTFHPIETPKVWDGDFGKGSPQFRAFFSTSTSLLCKNTYVFRILTKLSVLEVFSSYLCQTLKGVPQHFVGRHFFLKGRVGLSW